MRYLISVLLLATLLLAGCPATTPEAGEAPAAGDVVEEGAVETPETAEEEVAETPEAAEEETPAVEAGEGITETEEMTETEEITPTEGITETEEMTETEEIMPGEGITETEEMTETAGLTEGMATVNVGENEEFGEVLTDAEGRTLYTFTGTEEPADLGEFERVEAGEADTVGEGLDETMLGTMDQDGVQQLTYNDRPLYRYTGDMAPGDAMGQGVNEFAAIDALGEPIEQ